MRAHFMHQEMTDLLWHIYGNSPEKLDYKPPTGFATETKH